jgi:hypothetical protein
MMMNRKILKERKIMEKRNNNRKANLKDNLDREKLLSE